MSTICHKLTSKKRGYCRLSSDVDRFFDNGPRHIRISHSFVVDIDGFVRVLYNRSWRASSSYLQSQRMMTEIILEIFEGSARGVVTTRVLFIFDIYGKYDTVMISKFKLYFIRSTFWLISQILRLSKGTRYTIVVSYWSSYRGGHDEKDDVIYPRSDD